MHHEQKQNLYFLAHNFLYKNLYRHQRQFFQEQLLLLSFSVNKFLVEKMLEKPTAELLVNVRTDSQFGMAMTLAAGGVLTELLTAAVTILLPTNHNELENALKSLKISKLFDGFRGGEMIDSEKLVMALIDLAEGVQNPTFGIKEIEINPLFIYKGKVCAVDVLMRVVNATSGAVSSK